MSFTKESTLGKKINLIDGNKVVIDAMTADPAKTIDASIIFDGEMPSSGVKATVSFGSGGFNSQLIGKRFVNAANAFAIEGVPVYPGLILPVRGTNFRVELERTQQTTQFGAFISEGKPAFPAIIKLGEGVIAAGATQFLFTTAGLNLPFMPSFIRALKIERGLLTEPFYFRLNPSTAVDVPAQANMEWVEVPDAWNPATLANALVQNNGASNINIAVLAQLAI